MRSKEEITEQSERGKNRFSGEPESITSVNTELILELLLDIRELLINKRNHE